MRPPPLYLAACAMLWGQQTGHWPVALILAAVVESHRLVPTRWDLSTDDVRKLATISNVILVLVYLYFGITGPGRTHLPNVLQWWPVILLPLILPVQYSTRGDVSPTALFMMLKRRAEREGREPGRVHLGYAYAGVLVIAAGAANQRDLVYYAGLVLLAGWALWSIRSRRYSPVIWAGTFLLVSGIGLAAHIGLNGFQHWLVDAAVDFLSGTRTDPYRHSTDLGHIGSLKLSDEILLRVDLGGHPPPVLLHRASYNDYAAETWLARGAALHPMEETDVPGRWRLAPVNPGGEVIRITGRLEDGVGVLALPPGTAIMDNPVVVTMQRNRLGTVRAVGDAGLMPYTVQTDPTAALAGLADEIDLRVPETEAEVLRGVVAELGLDGQRPAEAVARIEDFFRSDFRYSLYGEGTTAGTPLGEFLTSSRAGHCEYFATATTLLLRAAGIPARYATGFAVQEYSELEDRHLVRVRHAHAWSRAFVDGRWIDVDTTPPAWFAAEAETASPLQPIRDLLSWAWHRYSLWRIADDEEGQLWVLLLAIPVIGYLLWRMRGPRRKSNGTHRETSEQQSADWPGLDSALLAIEARLSQQGLGRLPGETTAAWVRRLAGQDDRFRELLTLVDLHYRLRFAGQPPAPEERARLARAASGWID